MMQKYKRDGAESVVKKSRLGSNTKQAGNRQKDKRVRLAQDQKQVNVKK